MSTDKLTLLNQYLNGYTDENNQLVPGYTDSNRLGFCKLALRKYKFEKYKLNEHNIKPEDHIVQDNNIRSQLLEIVEKGECSVDDFKMVFDNLTVDQINYIGY